MTFQLSYSTKYNGKKLKNILCLVILSLLTSTLKAQTPQTLFPIDTLQLSVIGIKERLEIFKNIQRVLLPVLEKKSVFYSSNFQRNNQLIYKCKTPNRIDIFEIRINLLIPLENIRISGANIYTRVWQKVKNHHLIVSIEAKGRKQKKLKKEIIDRLKKMIIKLNS